jgi:methenyltetrahydromethanopterin cyclohydrolase
MSIPSVNREAIEIVKKICKNPGKYNVLVKRTPLGTHIIDAGIKAKGGLLIGKLITKICLGGLGDVSLSLMRIGGITLPSISVYTDHPSISTLGSQMAGWRIKVGEYTAMGSGPARALALKPKSIYEKIGYKDDASETVLVLETERELPEETIKMIAESCRVLPENLYVIITPTASIAGLTQISGRVVEVGIYRLAELGLDPKIVLHASGQAPILPVHPNTIESMGRGNDAILYGGLTYYIVEHEDDRYLGEIVEKSVSLISKDYGRPFSEIFKESGQDFYRIDPQIFAPAAITVTNKKTGKTFTAGKINAEILLKSIGLSQL